MWAVEKTVNVLVFLYLFAFLGKCSPTSAALSFHVAPEGRLPEFREPLLIAESLYAEREQSSVLFSCSPNVETGNSEPQGELVTSKVIWILDGDHLNIAATPIVIRDKKKYTCVEALGQLEITNVGEMETSGIYRCIPSNETGNNAAVELTVGKNVFNRHPTLLGLPRHFTSERENEKGTINKRERNSLGRAIGAGIAAFVFFCVSCTLYHYRWKPTLEQRSSTESDPKQEANTISPAFPLLISSPPTPPSPPAPPTNRVYLLSNSRHNSDANIIHPCIPLPPPPTSSPPRMFTPPLLTTTVEMTTISGKKLSTCSRDGSTPTIFLQPPLLTCSYSSTTKSGPSPNNTSKKISLLHPPTSSSSSSSSPLQKKFLATPESSSSSLSLVAEEECKRGAPATTSNYIPTDFSTPQKY